MVGTHVCLQEALAFQVQAEACGSCYLRPLLCPPLCSQSVFIRSKPKGIARACYEATSAAKHRALHNSDHVAGLSRESDESINVPWSW